MTLIFIREETIIINSLFENKYPETWNKIYCTDCRCWYGYTSAKISFPLKKEFQTQQNITTRGLLVPTSCWSLPRALRVWGRGCGGPWCCWGSSTAYPPGQVSSRLPDYRHLSWLMSCNISNGECLFECMPAFGKYSEIMTLRLTDNSYNSMSWPSEQNDTGISPSAIIVLPTKISQLRAVYFCSKT